MTLTVLGLPSGTSVVVNFTAESATAVNRSVSGGPSFSLSLPPGLYGVGARAVIGSGTVIYLPPGPLSTTVPVGATRSALTLIVIPEVNATGVLSLPSGVTAASVTVTLSSPLLNVSVDGSVFESGFRAAPGAYSAYATATVAGTTYASLSRVTVDPNGNITPSIVLSGAGPTLTGTLQNIAGTTIPLSVPVHLVSPDGAAAVANAVNGTFVLPLNARTTYAVFVNGTTPGTGPNGSYVQSWSAAAGASCTVGSVNSSCSVPLVGLPQPVWVNGTLVVPGVPGTVPGYAAMGRSLPVHERHGPDDVQRELLGPLGSGGVLAVRDRVRIRPIVGRPRERPGASVGGPRVVHDRPRANLGRYDLGRSPQRHRRQPRAGHGDRHQRARRPDRLRGPVAEFPARARAAGRTYLVQASAAGTFGGVAANASAETSVSILHGNVGTVLSLAYTETAAVTGTLVGPTSATVTAGGSVTFAFSVRNSGNVPVTVHPVGTPSYWAFNFSLTNVTLPPGPSGSVVSGEVRVLVPGGTPVAHPSLTIEFATANGTVIGSVRPAPTVNVVGYYGVAVGPSSFPTRVGPSTAEIPYYIENTGNVQETVIATISDSARLSGLGWSSNLSSAPDPSQVERTLAAGANLSLTVNLTATSSIFVPPGTVTVAVSVVHPPVPCPGARRSKCRSPPSPQGPVTVFPR